MLDTNGKRNSEHVSPATVVYAGKRGCALT